MRIKSHRILRQQTLACLLALVMMSFSFADSPVTAVDRLKVAEFPQTKYVIIEVDKEVLRLRKSDTKLQRCIVEKLLQSGSYKQIGVWDLHGATRGQQAGRLTLVEMGIVRTGQRLEYKNVQDNNRIKQTGIIKAIRFSE